MRIMISLFLISITALFVPYSYAAPTKWKINKYRIVQQAPDEIRNSAKEEAKLQQNRDFTGTVPGLTTVQMRALEKYFTDVGKEYQRLGFKEPKIETLTKAGDAFEIFVFDYDETETPAQYGPFCGRADFLFGVEYYRSNPDRFIRLDLSRIYKGSKISSSTFDNIAHEMFHAIQYSYPLFIQDTKDNCKIGGWIVEATAEAVGADMALTLKNIKINEIKTGPRDYSKPLYVQHASGATKNRAYWTASLWRYIGEYVSNGQKFPPVKQNQRPDYRYLQKFFMKTIDRYNQEAELGWLDDNLDTQFSANLTNIYSNFISSFAHYVPDRIGHSQKSYLKRLFQGCERVTLTADISSFDTAGRKFSKVSARCFEVFYEGPEDKIDIGVYMTANQKTVGSIQHIGVKYHKVGGSNSIKVIKAINGSLPSGKFFADWTFVNVPFVRRSRNGPKSNVFIISNITDKASDTHANPIVSFRVSYAESVGNVTVTQSGP